MHYIVVTCWANSESYMCLDISIPEDLQASGVDVL